MVHFWTKDSQPPQSWPFDLVLLLPLLAIRNMCKASVLEP